MNVLSTGEFVRIFDKRGIKGVMEVVSATTIGMPMTLA